MGGRFISRDPIRFAAGDINLYRFVGNNPYSFVDPFGLDQTGSEDFKPYGKVHFHRTDNVVVNFWGAIGVQMDIVFEPYRKNCDDKCISTRMKQKVKTNKISGACPNDKPGVWNLDPCKDRSTSDSSSDYYDSDKRRKLLEQDALNRGWTSAQINGLWDFGGSVMFDSPGRYPIQDVDWDAEADVICIDQRQLEFLLATTRNPFFNLS